MGKNFEFTAVVKSDEPKRQLVGTIYAADKIDTQGEFMTVQELERAAHRALANGVQIDVGHDGKPLHKAHAALVESAIVDGVWRGVVQLSKAAWSQLVESGKVKAFSIGGSAPRRTIEKGGQTVREIYDASVRFISLVARGANGELAVAKSDDMPAWAKTIAEQLETLTARIAQNAANLDALEKRRAGKATVADIRKSVEAEADARTAARISQLTKRHATLSARLNALWEDPGIAIGSGRSARAMENDLCVEIAKCEQELDTLRDQDWSGASAFDFRGGKSGVIDAGQIFTAGDSAFDRPATPRDGGRDIGDILL